MAELDERTRVSTRMKRVLSSDFWDMAEFARTERPDRPWDALNALGLRLCGAFDHAFFDGNDEALASMSTHTHMRFSHDPPEAFTCMIDIARPARHWCYISDSHTEPPLLVAYCDAAAGDGGAQPRPGAARSSSSSESGRSDGAGSGGVGSDAGVVGASSGSTPSWSAGVGPGVFHNAGDNIFAAVDREWARRQGGAGAGAGAGVSGARAQRGGGRGGGRGAGLARRGVGVGERGGRDTGAAPHATHGGIAAGAITAATRKRARNERGGGDGGGVGGGGGCGEHSDEEAEGKGQGGVHREAVNGDVGVRMAGRAGEARVGDRAAPGTTRRVRDAAGAESVLDTSTGQATDTGARVHKHVPAVLARMRAFAQARGWDVSASTQWAQRRARCAAHTFSGLGVCVPVDKSTDVGYRPLPLTPRELAKLFATSARDEASRGTFDRSRYYEITRWTTIANDECDFGMGLEWGLQLLAGPMCVGGAAVAVLGVVYGLLGREVYGECVEQHARVRSREVAQVDEVAMWRKRTSASEHGGGAGSGGGQRGRDQGVPRASDASDEGGAVASGDAAGLGMGKGDVGHAGHDNAASKRDNAGEVSISTAQEADAAFDNEVESIEPGASAHSVGGPAVVESDVTADHISGAAHSTQQQQQPPAAAAPPLAPGRGWAD